LDAEGYRKKREETLIRLANKMAEKAVYSKRPVKLEPMNPYERRIIHSALQTFDGVNTYSEGNEPYRRVVILTK
jgi:spoIIIJ-associated protein